MTHLFSSVMLLLGVSILFWTFAHYIKKLSVSQKSTWETYCQRERVASLQTRREFPHQLLLTFQKDNIPHSPSSSCDSTYNRILDFIDLPMVSLSTYSNVELKEQFGINHFNKLICYEETYMYFMKAIEAYISCLEDEGFMKEAQDLNRYYHCILTEVKKNKN